MRIFFLFGEMGVGKNYIGEQLAAFLGYDFYDGDDSLPRPMKYKVANFQSLTMDEIEGFVRYFLIPDIERLDRNIVVAQALYRSEHRAIIDEYFGKRVEWVYIEPPSLIEHVRRLLSRRRGIRWAILCLLSKPFFQKPASGTPSIKSVKDVNIRDIWKN